MTAFWTLALGSPRLASLFRYLTRTHTSWVEECSWMSFKAHLSFSCSVFFVFVYIGVASSRWEAEQESFLFHLLCRTACARRCLVNTLRQLGLLQRQGNELCKKNHRLKWTCWFLESEFKYGSFLVLETNTISQDNEKSMVHMVSLLSQSSAGVGWGSGPLGVWEEIPNLARREISSHGSPSMPILSSTRKDLGTGLHLSYCENNQVVDTDSVT